MDTISTALTVKPSQAASAIVKALKAKKVPMLHGSPAIGKSSIARAIAEKHNLLLIDERLSQADPTDLKGFPHIIEIAGQKRATFIPMDTFPIEGTPLPINSKTGKSYDGWLLFLDELNSAKEDVQAAAYKIILDRMVGQFQLHERVMVVAAGNLESDNAIVQEMSTALKSRMVHLVLGLDHKEWINWAIDHQFDHRITDYLQFKPDSLYTFDPNSADMTYGAPRTWHFADDVLRICGGDVDDPDFLFLASGCVSEGLAREFITYCEIYSQLPKLDQILMAPGMMPVPTEPSILFALTGMLGSSADVKNIAGIMEYAVRMPIEFQVVTLRYVVKRDRNMLNNPAVSGWVATHGSELF